MVDQNSLEDVLARTRRAMSDHGGPCLTYEHAAALLAHIDAQAATIAALQAVFSEMKARDLTDEEVEAERERLGRIVRNVWIEWALEQPNPKPSWLQEWDELTEPEREVDRRIGWALSSWAYGKAAHMQAQVDQQAQTIAALTEFHRLCWLIWSDYANGGSATAALERLDRALTQSDAALAAATPKEER